MSCTGQRAGGFFRVPASLAKTGFNTPPGTRGPPAAPLHYSEGQCCRGPAVIFKSSPLTAGSVLFILTGQALHPQVNKGVSIPAVRGGPGGKEVVMGVVVYQDGMKYEDIWEPPSINKQL